MASLEHYPCVVQWLAPWSAISGSVRAYPDGQ
jgi:hypothetical protein